jgi:hypothetical protein
VELQGSARFLFDPAKKRPAGLLAYFATDVDHTISPRQVAYAAIEAKQIRVPDSATKCDIVARFTNVLYDLTRRRTGPTGHRVRGGRLPLATRICCDRPKSPIVKASRRRY